MGRPRKFKDRVTFSLAMEREERERLRNIALSASSHSRTKVSSSEVARQALARHLYRLLEDDRARRQPPKPPPRE